MQTSIVRFVVGTDSKETSEKILEYLETRLTDADELYIVNVIPTSDADADEVRMGQEGLDVLEDRLSDYQIESHQFVRGTKPADELLQLADETDADELVIGIHKHTPAGKVIFGSTAQRLLQNTTRPVVTIPLLA